jgi:hypothetical protein
MKLSERSERPTVVSRTASHVTIAALMRRLVSVLAVPVLVLALAACTPTGAPNPAASAAPTVPAGAISVTGHAHAGPVCPVEKVPPDPACADRPVVGAVLVVRNSAGAEVARATTAADGTFSVALAPGDYVLVPQPAAGLMGTAQPLPFHVQGEGAAPAPLDVAYDTGIR